MKDIEKTSVEIYEILGEGYGFNGPKDKAIILLNEKLTEIAKIYSNKAFVAGRSKQTWKSFYLYHFI